MNEEKVGLSEEDGGWRGRQAQELRKLIQEYSFSRQDTDGPPDLIAYPKVASNNYNEGADLEGVSEDGCQDWESTLEDIGRMPQEGDAALKRRGTEFDGMQQRCERLWKTRGRYYDSSRQVTDALCVPDTGSNTVDYAKARSLIKIFCAQKGNFTLDALSPVTNIDEINSENGKKKKQKKEKGPATFNIAVDLGSSPPPLCNVGKFVIAPDLCEDALMATIDACQNKVETRGGFARVYVLCRESGRPNANQASVGVFIGRQ